MSKELNIRTLQPVGLSSISQCRFFCFLRFFICKRIAIEPQGSCANRDKWWFAFEHFLTECGHQITWCSLAGWTSCYQSLEMLSWNFRMSHLELSSTMERILPFSSIFSSSFFPIISQRCILTFLMVYLSVPELLDPHLIQIIYPQISWSIQQKFV